MDRGRQALSCFFAPLTFKVSGEWGREGGAHFALPGAKRPASWRTEPARADTVKRRVPVLDAPGSAGRIVARNSPGNHVTMMLPPHAQALASKVRTILDGM